MSWRVQRTTGDEHDTPARRSPERDGRPATTKPSPTAHLESLLARALQGSPPRRELMLGVCAFTDELRRQGLPIEKILVRLKATVAHARAVSWSAKASVGEPPNVDDITAKMVRCCIEYFYDHPDEQNSTEDDHAGK
jgi:hypothetical protein